MAPIGWLLGRRFGEQTGEYDRVEIRKSMLHWFSILLAIAGIAALCIARHIEGQVVGQFIAMTIGLIYFLGGVHFDRNLLWLGPLLMAGAVAITWVPNHGSTTLGLLVGLGLVVHMVPRQTARCVTEGELGCHTGAMLSPAAK